MFWHPVAHGENSPFMLVSIRYADETGRTTGYGYCVAKKSGTWTPRGLDFDVVTRETASRRDAERTLAAYDRDYATCNSETIAAMFPSVEHYTYQVTSREDRIFAGRVIDLDELRTLNRNGVRGREDRSVSPGLVERFMRPSSSKLWNICGSGFVDLSRDMPIDRTIDIVPQGDSLVSAPTYSVWYDGNLETSTAEDFERALAIAFYDTAWPGGNDVAWYDGWGNVLCAQCAAEHWVETGVSLTPQAEEQEYGYGLYCENDPKHCIAEPECVNCRKDLDDLWAAGVDVFIASDEAPEPHYLCRDCLESLVESAELASHEPDRHGAMQYIATQPGEWFLHRGVVYADMHVDLSVYAEGEE